MFRLEREARSDDAHGAVLKFELEDVVMEVVDGIARLIVREVATANVLRRNRHGFRDSGPASDEHTQSTSSATSPQEPVSVDESESESKRGKRKRSR